MNTPERRNCLARFFDKAQYRAQALFAAVLGIVALARALLVVVNCFNRGVDVDANLGILQTHSCQTRSRRMLMTSKSDFAWLMPGLST